MRDFFWTTKAFKGRRKKRRASNHAGKKWVEEIGNRRNIERRKRVGRH